MYGAEQGISLRVSKIGYPLVLAGALLLYALTCAPGPLWQDSGMFQYRIWHMDFEGKYGLALAHPLYILIGAGVKEIPLESFGYRVNLISAVCTAFAVANLFLLLTLWLGRTMPALAGAVSLAFSHTVWLHACIAEVYALYIALFTAELIFLLRYLQTGRERFLALLGFFNGLSISTHMFGILPLACYGWLGAASLMQRRIEFRRIALFVCAWGLGAGFYLFFILKQVAVTGSTMQTVSSALFGNGFRGSVLNLSIPLRVVIENMLFLGLNFPGPGLLLFGAGLLVLYNPRKESCFSVVLAGILILFYVFAFRYRVPGRYAFFIPFYCLAAACIGAGFSFLCDRVKQKGFRLLVLCSCVLPVGVYATAPVFAKKMNFSIGAVGNAYRDVYRYFLQPWKTGYNEPERFAAAALDAVEPGAVILATGTSVYALWYVQQVEGGLRGDVDVLSTHGNYRNPAPYPAADTIEPLMAGRAVYVDLPENIDWQWPGYAPERYTFVKAGPLYRMVLRE